MSLSKEQRKEILKRLPFGSQAEIARKIGRTRSAVGAWFNGASNSFRTEVAVIEYLDVFVKQNKEIDERLRAILSE